MLLSLTRLRLASVRHLAAFLRLSRASLEQAQQDPACGGGATYFGPGLVFWTATLWHDEKALLAYVRSEAHLEAMPYLREWCSEACVSRATRDALPSRHELPALLAASPRFTGVAKPSALQQSKIVSPKRPWVQQTFREPAKRP